MALSWLYYNTFCAYRKVFSCNFIYFLLLTDNYFIFNILLTNFFFSQVISTSFLFYFHLKHIFRCDIVRIGKGKLKTAYPEIFNEPFYWPSLFAVMAAIFFYP